MKKTRRLVLIALMVSQALVLSIIESWIPVPIGIPGIKLGLANIITLIVIIFFGYKDALLVVIARCILSSIFAGGPVIFLYSITGGILSTLVMAYLFTKLSRWFSALGISIAGSITHNMGQLIVASIMLRELLIMSYLPILLVSGIVMGCFVGLCSSFLSNALKKIGIVMWLE